jgi:mono/diheme cytochrome c family protein
MIMRLGVRRAAGVVVAMAAIAGAIAGCRGDRSVGAGAGHELALGGEAYLAQCSVCHGIEGKGDGPLAASIDAEHHPRPASFTAEMMRTLGRRGVLQALGGETHLRSGAAMPLWGPHLGRDWMNRIAGFVVDLPRLDEAGRGAMARYLATPGDTNGTGRRTYVTYCSSCHGPQGDGDAFFTPAMGLAPPPLGSDVLHSLTDEEIARFLAPAGPHSDRAPNVPGWLYTISPAERAGLVAYLRVMPGSPDED